MSEISGASWISGVKVSEISGVSGVSGVSELQYLDDFLTLPGTVLML